MTAKEVRVTLQELVDVLVVANLTIPVAVSVLATVVDILRGFKAPAPPLGELVEQYVTKVGQVRAVGQQEVARLRREVRR